MKNGIDVSYAQGKIDWSKVKTDFVYIKASEGAGCKDVMLPANAAGAKQYGIPFGFYHFVTLNKVDVVGDAKSEAQDFIQTLAGLPKYHPSLIPVLDIEQENKLQISPANIQLWINTFVDEMAKAGHKTMLYSYTPYLNANLPKDHNLSRLPLWLAQYTNAFAPVLPFGWKNYTIWQRSNKGRIPGINTDVDLNLMNTL